MGWEAFLPEQHRGLKGGTPFCRGYLFMRRWPPCSAPPCFGHLNAFGVLKRACLGFGRALMEAGLRLAEDSVCVSRPSPTPIGAGWARRHLCQLDRSIMTLNALMMALVVAAFPTALNGTSTFGRANCPVDRHDDQPHSRLIGSCRAALLVSDGRHARSLTPRSGRPWRHHGPPPYVLVGGAMPFGGTNRRENDQS